MFAVLHYDGSQWVEARRFPTSAGAYKYARALESSTVRACVRRVPA